MKIYAIWGTEGSPDYIKQSMKLPKSWSDKPVSQVVELFVETYNKKHADAPLDAATLHLEKPLGSIVIPSEHISTALAECVSGTRRRALRLPPRRGGDVHPPGHTPPSAFFLSPGAHPAASHRHLVSRALQ